MFLGFVCLLHYKVWVDTSWAHRLKGTCIFLGDVSNANLIMSLPLLPLSRPWQHHCLWNVHYLGKYFQLYLQWSIFDIRLYGSSKRDLGRESNKSLEVKLVLITTPAHLSSFVSLTPATLAVCLIVLLSCLNRCFRTFILYRKNLNKPCPFWNMKKKYKSKGIKKTPDKIK